MEIVCLRTSPTTSSRLCLCRIRQSHSCSVRWLTLDTSTGIFDGNIEQIWKYAYLSNERESADLFSINRRLAVLILSVVIASPIVYWLASPLFINVRVSEPLPSTGQELTSLTKGMFIDADSFHKTSGAVTIFQSTNGSRLVQLTDFKTTNGPDLFVYLATDTTAKDSISVGPLKGNIGDQHYLLSSDVDLSRYRYTLIWCRTFAVLFGSAQLS